MTAEKYAPAGPPGTPWFRLLLCALLLTLAQVAAVLAAQGRPRLKSAYLRLAQWDAVHYQDIAEGGYRGALPDRIPLQPDNRDALRATNVGFFPGYPLVARVLTRATGMPFAWGMTLTAQVCAAGFWMYLLLLLRQWKTGFPLGAWAVVALFAYPSAFYLVIPYSESLFLCAFMGFLYWYGVPGRTGKILAVLHGFVMSWTRIAGLFLAGFPAAHEASAPSHVRRGRGVLTAALVTCLAASGTLSFFIYCHVAFGHWNAYMLTQQWGWNITADLLAPARSVFPLLLPPLARIGREPDVAGRLLASLYLWLLLLWPAAEVLRRRFAARDGSWRSRFPLWALACAQLWILLSTLMAVNFSGMIRNLLATHLLVTLLVICFLRQMPRLPRPAAWSAGILAGAVACLSFFLQMAMIARFTGGGWVA